MPTSIIVAVFISKTGRYRWALWLGWIATIAATGVTIILDKNTSTAGWIFIFAFVGFGHGVLFNALLISAQASSSAPDAAYAASIGSPLRQGVVTAYLYGLGSIFKVMTGIGGLGLVATAFVAARTMNKPIESDHVLLNVSDSA
ncbi:hypothetical protein RU639_006166 [Aspergillus parasiticus]